MFAAWAKDPYARNGHSYANGASMRVIPIGYAYDSLEQTLLQAKASCLSTHNHREAIVGAQAVAASIFMARNGADKEQIKAYLKKRLNTNCQRHFTPSKKRMCLIAVHRIVFRLQLLHFWNRRIMRAQSEMQSLLEVMQIHRRA